MIRPLKPGVFGAATFRHLDGVPVARLRLDRWWEPSLVVDPITKRPDDDRFRPLVVIGVNPSEAGADGDDNTSAKCITFARRENANGLVMGNLDPRISKKPKFLHTINVPYGTHDHHWDAIDAALSENAVAIVAAWGKPPAGWDGYDDAVKRVKRIAEDVGVDLMCFGQNGDGSPKHPLYLAGDTPLELWWRPR